MYTWEIEDLLKLRNYILYNDEYLKMISTSPQIKCINYNSFKNEFEAYTKEDDKSEHSFKFKVKIRNKK